MIYSKRNTNDSCIGYVMCCSICTLAMLAITVFISIIPLVTYYDLKKDTCSVIGVKYPSELPTFENTDNWISCDCGTKCVSWTPCIKIFIEESNHFMVNYYSYKDLPCTFYENSCPNGENVQYLIKDLNESIELADIYIGTTIDCYYSSYYNTYSLNNDLYSGSIYAMIAFAGLCICILSVCTIQYCKREKT
mgnify:CR=1 FL=1|jgi:hypothetical protein